MDNGTIGHFSPNPRSVATVGHAVRCLVSELHDYCRAAFLGRQFVSAVNTGQRGILPEHRSLPSLRRHVAPRVRAGLSRGRLQWNVETPILEVPAIHTRRSSADQTQQGPLLTLSVIRALVGGLVLIALIPNLVLGAILYLGIIDLPGSKAVHPTNETSASATQSATISPVLSAPTVVKASVGADVALPIALDGTDGVPARSIIAIRGLPQGSKLSSGRPYDETEWNLRTDEIGDLHLVVPGNANGEAKLLLQLVAPDGAILADAATVLQIPTNFATTMPASSTKTVLAEAQSSGEHVPQAAGENNGETLVNPDIATATPEDPEPPLPSRRPFQTSSEGANSITLTSVNLRKGPTRSAPAIGVVVKGAKLHLIERKRGWVRVTNLATSEEGWIYARHVTTVR
jgi:hypothetical protein